ncbi:hypothetical protein PH28N_08324 [Cutibacterium modestum 28N]|nr:hypothetical protein [Cutibacterium modestum 28N]
MTALAVSSFSIAIPAHATTSSSPVQNSVKTQPKAQVKGIIDGLCAAYPRWCD